jgi:hypothetical protein
MALVDTDADVLGTSADWRFGWVEVVFNFTPATFLFLILNFIDGFLYSRK